MVKRLGLLALSVAVFASCQDNTLPTDPDDPDLHYVGSYADFTVNVNDDVDDGVCDSSHCSLREAINAANAKPGKDVIGFRIPGYGVHTIQPLKELPAITDPAVVDGYTQKGARPALGLLRSGLNARLKIELDGSKAGNARGLAIRAGNTTVRGLVINNFAGFAGIEMSGTGGNIIAGNFIGTDPDGSSALGNLRGVALSSVHDNVIANNLISGNNQGGLFLLDANRNRVFGNLIGTQRDGKGPLGNASTGVFTTGDASYNVIGGKWSVLGNTIAYNSNGVMIFTGTGNAILSNSIFSNYNPALGFGGLGIDLDGSDQGVTPNDPGDVDTGANERQNFPVLKSTDGKVIEGTLNSTVNTKFTLQFFGNDSCDPSGHGEGQWFLGSKAVTTDGSGNVSFRYRVSRHKRKFAGGLITATATDPSGNTSEFSECVQPSS